LAWLGGGRIVVVDVFRYEGSQRDTFERVRIGRVLVCTHATVRSRVRSDHDRTLYLQSSRSSSLSVWVPENDSDPTTRSVT
jgi:hypothetical protein